MIFSAYSTEIRRDYQIPLQGFKKSATPYHTGRLSMMFLLSKLKTPSGIIKKPKQVLFNFDTKPPSIYKILFLNVSQYFFSRQSYTFSRKALQCHVFL